MWCIPVTEHLEQAQYRGGGRRCTLPKGSRKQGTPIHMWCIPVSEQLEQAPYMAGDKKCTLPKHCKKQGTSIHMICIPVPEHYEQAQHMAGEAALYQKRVKHKAFQYICDAFQYLNT